MHTVVLIDSERKPVETLVDHLSLKAAINILKRLQVKYNRERGGIYAYAVEKNGKIVAS